MAESVDASDLKSDWAHPQCQFKSGSGHHPKELFLAFLFCLPSFRLSLRICTHFVLQLRFTVQFSSKIAGIHGCTIRLCLIYIRRQVWLRAPSKGTLFRVPFLFTFFSTFTSHLYALCATTAVYRSIFFENCRHPRLYYSFLNMFLEDIKKL